MNEVHGRRGALRHRLRHADAHRELTKELGREISERLTRLAGLITEAQGFGATERLPMDAVELVVDIPLRRPSEGYGEAGSQLAAQFDQLIGEALRAAGAFQIGRVYCFLCDSAECEHSHPVERTAAFVGYSPNGKPEWRSFINICMERREERVDQLYGPTSDIIAILQEPDELADGLLPRFGKEDHAFRLLGQVVVGLLPATLDRRMRSETRVALTLQLIETQGRGGKRRVRVNLLGLSMEEICAAAGSAGSKSPAEALRRTVVAMREKADLLGRQAARVKRDGGAVDLEGLALPLLRKLRGDIERIFRASKRRTGHAERRHTSGERPTGDAMNDVAQAAAEHFYHDTRRSTVVVLGSKGRAHVFSAAGRHVTSLRLDPGELRRKTERGRWQPLDPQAAIQLRARLSGLPGA